MDRSMGARTVGLDVVWAVAVENIGLDRRLAFEQFVSQGAKARTTIEDDHAFATTNFNARRIPAIARHGGVRARNTSAHPPKSDGYVRHLKHTKTLGQKNKLLCEPLHTWSEEIRLV